MRVENLVNRGYSQTLNAKFFKAWATPGLFSNLLPALTKKVTAEVGCPLSTAATLTPLAESTTVAKERARRVELRTAVVDGRNIGEDGGRVWVRKEMEIGGCSLVGARNRTHSPPSRRCPTRALAIVRAAKHSRTHSCLQLFPCHLEQTPPTMDLLSLHTPLPWEDTKKLADHIRFHGITQFLHRWDQVKDRYGDE
jgi:hypothetical protein